MESGLSTRLEDFLKSLDAIVEYVESHDIDLVIFAGDAYKTRTPTPTLVRELCQRLARIAAICPLDWIIGNHDLPGDPARANTAEILETLNVEGVSIIDRPKVVNHGTVQVIGIPWPTRHNLMASEKVAGLPAEEVNRLMAEAVSETIKRLAHQLDPNLPAILAAHLTVEGGAFGGERSVMLGSDVVIPLEAVALPQFDYVALGHLHRHQQLYDNPPVVYSGSIERLDFGEEKEEKGFVVVTLGQHQGDELFGNGAYTEVEFVPLPVRRFQTIRVHLDGTDPTDAVMQSIHESQIEDAVVRVIIEGTSQTAAMLDEGAIQRALEPALKHYVIKQIDRQTRTRLEGLSYEEMKPLELLNAWLGSNGKAPEEREALMKAAEELMKEVAA
jgi:exonuclease SbcD